jgi:hypothetical protein
MNKKEKDFQRARRDLFFSTAGGFIAGGSLLSYQILIDRGNSILFSAGVAAFVAFAIYGISLRQVKKSLK